MFADDILDLQIKNGMFSFEKATEFRLSEIEKEIENLPYNGERKTKDVAVEKAKLPSMAEAFYSFLVLYGTIPTQDDFVFMYLRRAFLKEAPGQYRIKGREKEGPFTYRGLRGRLLRTYPSLIRDFHFYVMCLESSLFEEVFYSIRQDYESGIDLKVVVKGSPYYVSLFVQTQRGRSFKKQKYNRRDYDLSREICLLLDPYHAKNKVGRFSLYDESHLKQLLDQIQKISSESKSKVCFG